MPIRWIALVLCTLLVVACKSNDPTKPEARGTTLTAQPEPVVTTQAATPTPTAARPQSPTPSPQPRQLLTLLPVALRLQPSSEAGWQYMLLTLGVRNDGTEAMQIEFPNSRLALDVVEGPRYDGNLASEVRGNFSVASMPRDFFKDFTLPPSVTVCAFNGRAIWAVVRIPAGITPVTLRVPGFPTVDLTDAVPDGTCPTSQLAKATGTPFLQLPYSGELNSRLALQVVPTRFSTATFRAVELDFVAQSQDQFGNVAIDIKVLALDTDGTVWTPISNSGTGECSLLGHSGSVGPLQTRTFRVCFPTKTYLMYSARISGTQFLFVP